MRNLKIVLLAFCALVCAGCADKEKEKADMARVVAMRDSIGKQTEVLRELIELEKGDGLPGREKWEATMKDVKDVLAKPASVDQLPKLEGLSKDLTKAGEELQALVDKHVDEVRKANERTQGR